MSRGPARRQVVRVGDVVRFEGAEYEVVGLEGAMVRLAPAGNRPPGTSTGTSVVLLTHLLAAPDFAVLSDPGPGARTGPVTVLTGLPPAAAERATWWQRHLVELMTGLTPDAEPGTPPRREYDPLRVSLRARETAKVEELERAGEQVSLKTVQRMRRRYERAGLAGLVDRRLAPHDGPPEGRVDRRVVEAVREAMAATAQTSTVSRATLMRQVEQRLRDHTTKVGDDADDEVEGAAALVMPSRATFYRLVEAIEAGRGTFASARTRRSLARRPDGAHTVVTALRPGELMEIDSTPLDVLVVLDDGSTDRAELTGLVDIATRTLAAVVLRPSTKAVDAALLLARALTPQPLRPGWPDALRMARSVLPYPAMLDVDERLAAAAAQPVIFPETIVCDRGKVYVSAAFRSACQSLGVSLQPAHPRTPTDKPIIERTLGSVSGLFAQHVAGYTGRSVEHRGGDVAADAVWPIHALQDLLEEWVVACWQHRPHEGLRDPLTPGVMLSPNEKYAALVAVAGYVPVALSAQEYIGLLPSCWRAITTTGIRIGHRSYDTDGLNPLRGQRSGVAGRGHRWQVHYDPYDVTRVWVRDHWNDHGNTEWIMVPWRHLSTAPAPFGEAAWRHAREIVARRGTDPGTETEIAQAVASILQRAATGPDDIPEGQAGDASQRTGKTSRESAAARRKDRKKAARARAAIPDRRAAPAGLRPDHEPDPAAPAPQAAQPDGAGRTAAPAPQPPGAEVLQRHGEQDDEVPAVVVPLEIFDAARRHVGDGDLGCWSGGPGPAGPDELLSGWRRFVQTDPASFGLLPDEQWQGLDDAARQTYDEARLDYHSELVVVTTSTVKTIIRQGSLLTVLNRREVGARRGLIVSGDGTTGKTTALKQFGRAYELRVRARYPDPGRIPVVYVTTPASGSPRKLALEFARFLGLPEFTRRDNTTDIAEAVCRVLVDAKIDVVLVDEIHNLNLATRPGEDLSDHLKYFTEHIPATFVYAGIDVERSGLFTGIRGRQLAGRCVLLRTSAFGCVAEWHQLIAALEGALRLHAHAPGTLAGQARYLHQRTGGMIGSLMHLVRAAAITAILDGTEAITPDLLDDIQIDHSAQSAATPALLSR